MLVAYCPILGRVIGAGRFVNRPYDVRAAASLWAMPEARSARVVMPAAAEDIDGDGFPGATVHIAGKCDGQVYVSNQSTTTLVSGRATEDGMTGEINVLVRQKVLGASGFCLKLVAGDSDEKQTGTFAFRRIAIGSNCRNLAGKPWPVKAPPPVAIPKGK